MEGLKSLETFLDDNNIEILTRQTFQSLTNLTVLNLTKNSLSNISSDLFEDLVSLDELLLGMKLLKVFKTFAM